MKKLITTYAFLMLVSGIFAQTTFIVGGIKYITYDNTVEVTSNSPIYTGSITIPSIVVYSAVTYSVTSIGSSAFYGCTGINSITIPSSVTSIGQTAFYGCSSLTTITIPSSVTSIGEGAFYGTTWYNSQPDGIVYAGKVAYTFKGYSNYMFSINSLTLDEGTTGIADHAFAYCMNLTSITIPSSVTSIGYQSFYGCTGINSIIIPSSVTSIGGDAFYKCTSLTSITIPSSVTSIGSGTFSGTAWYDSQPAGLVYAGNVALAYKGTLPATSITLNAVTTGIADYFSTYGSDITSITSINIPNSVISIGNYSFSDCSKLTSVTIPNSVTSIGDHAFERCMGLTSLTIPSSINSIADGAFVACTGLTSITIPNSVTGIGHSAFSECASLTSITIPSSVTWIGSNAFWKCSGLTSISISSSVTSIGSAAFVACTGLTSVTIPSSVTSIGSSAFNSCIGLTSIYAYPTTPVDLSSSSSVFEYVKTSCTLYVPKGSKAAYQVAAQWKDFTNIVEMDITEAPTITNESISLYPNPVNDRFIVSGFDGTAVLKLTDINGRIFLLKKIVNNESVSMNSLPKGLYIVKLITIECTKERKVIKR